MDEDEYLAGVDWDAFERSYMREKARAQQLQQQQQQQQQSPAARAAAAGAAPLPAAATAFLARFSMSPQQPKAAGPLAAGQVQQQPQQPQQQPQQQQQQQQQQPQHAPPPHPQPPPPQPPPPPAALLFEYRPKCPYAVCPGIFTACGGKLRLGFRLTYTPVGSGLPPAQGHHHHHHHHHAAAAFPGAPLPPMPPPPPATITATKTYYFHCTAPRCAWRYYPAPEQREPQVAIEVVSSDAVRVTPVPGAEAAVARAGGLRALLRVPLEQSFRARLESVELRGAELEAAIARGVGADPSTGRGKHALVLPRAATTGAPAAVAVVAEAAGAADGDGGGAEEEEPEVVVVPATEDQEEEEEPQEPQEWEKEPARYQAPEEEDADAAAQAADPDAEAEAEPAAPTFRYAEDEQLFFRMRHAAPVQNAIALWHYPLPAGATARVLASHGAIPGPVLATYQRPDDGGGAPLPPPSAALLLPPAAAPPQPVAQDRPIPRCSPREVARRLSRVPRPLARALLPFQRAGVSFCVERGGRAMLADEMGVGKTVQAIAAASAYDDEWPLLCVVPASLRLVWAEELERWLPHLRPADVRVIEGRDDRLTSLPGEESGGGGGGRGRGGGGGSGGGGAAALGAPALANESAEEERQRRRRSMPRVTVTSFEMMKRLTCDFCQRGARFPTGSRPAHGGGSGGGGSGGGAPGGNYAPAVPAAAAASAAALARANRCPGPGRCMAALPWGVVVVDESHNLRTTASPAADAPSTEACVAACKRAPRCLMLTGTPSLSRPYDLYRQVDALRPGLLGATKDAFAGRYCDRRLVPILGRRGFFPAAGDGGGFGGGGGGGPAAPLPLPLPLPPPPLHYHQNPHQHHQLQQMQMQMQQQQYNHHHHHHHHQQQQQQPKMRRDLSGGARLIELHGLLVREVMVRRLKRDVLAQLPPKRRQVIRLPQPPASRWPQGAFEDLASAAPEKKGGGGGGAAARRRHGGEDGDGGEGHDGRHRMSLPHATALAKLPDAIAWLMQALQVSGGGDGLPKARGKKKGEAGTAAQGSGKAPRASGSGGAEEEDKTASGEDGGVVSASGDEAAEEGGDDDGEQQEEAEQGDNDEATATAAAAAKAASRRAAAPPKFLVFAHHRDVMRRLEEALGGHAAPLSDQDGEEEEGEERAAAEDEGKGRRRRPARPPSSPSPSFRGVGYVRIDGSVEPSHRMAEVRRFRDDPSVRVALLSITATAVGLDFSSAQAVVFVELPDEVALVRQAEDRAHRRGQRRPVNVYFLCAKGTSDDRRWQALNNSLGQLTQVHDGACGGEAGVAAAAAEAEAAAGAAAAAGGGGTRPPSGAGALEAAPPPQPPQPPQQPIPRAAGGTGMVVDAVYEVATQAPGGGGMRGRRLLGEEDEEGRRREEEEEGRAEDGGRNAPAPAPGAAVMPGLPELASSQEEEEQEDGAKQQPALPPPPPPAVAAPAAADADTNAAAQTLPPPPPVWYEISAHTGRLHFHLAADGSEPLGLSVPMELLALSAGAGGGSNGGPRGGSASGGGGGRAHSRSGSKAPAALAAPSRPATGGGGSAPSSAGARCQPRPRRRRKWVESGSTSEDVGGSSEEDERAGADSGGGRLSEEEEEDEEEEALGVDPSAAAAAAAAREAEPYLADAIEAVIARWPEPQAAAAATGTAAAAAPPQQPPPAYSSARLCEGGWLSAFGLVAPARPMARASLRALLLDARAFARGWSELRAVTRNRLQGRVLAPCLASAADAAAAEAAAAGAFGLGTERYAAAAAGGPDAPAPPPLAGCEWRRVLVRPPPGGAEGRGRRAAPEALCWQAFDVRTGARRCLRCNKNVHGGGGGGGGGGGKQQKPKQAAAAAADDGDADADHSPNADDDPLMLLEPPPPPPQAQAPPPEILEGCVDLFCSIDCERAHYLGASGAAVRRQLFRLERGVCVLCGLDAHALAARLRAIDRGRAGWLARRRACLRRLAPRLATEPRHKVLAERLLAQAAEGYAWQADHIVPVYKGGGACGLDNLRTLCVACHADVTRAQARERAESRRRGVGGDLRGVPDIRTMLRPNGGGKGKKKDASGKGRKRGRVSEAEEEEDGEEWQQRAAFLPSSGDEEGGAPRPRPPPQRPPPTKRGRVAAGAGAGKRAAGAAAAAAPEQPVVVLLDSSPSPPGNKGRQPQKEPQQPRRQEPKKKQPQQQPQAPELVVLDDSSGDDEGGAAGAAPPPPPKQQQQRPRRPAAPPRRRAQPATRSPSPSPLPAYIDDYDDGDEVFY
jgi:hypothetical protein